MRKGTAANQSACGVFQACAGAGERPSGPALSPRAPHLHKILHERLRGALYPAIGELVREGLFRSILGEDGEMGRTAVYCLRWPGMGDGDGVANHVGGVKWR